MCSSYGKTPADPAVTFAAQNTVALCTAIRDSLGNTEPVLVQSARYACIERKPDSYFICSNAPSCPTEHLTASDGAAFGYTSICLCQ